MSKSEKKPKGKFNLSLIFGSWTPPPYLSFIGRWISSFFSAIFRGIKAHKKLTWAVLGICLLGCLGYWGFLWVQARKPQMLELKYTIDGPYPRTKADDEISSVYFYFSGSAIRAGLEESEAVKGVSLSPEIKGNWKWNSDSSLQFTPEEDWGIGQNFTVTFQKDFFPSHVKAIKTATFTTENFYASISSAEFYIDPENPSTKRITTTVSANYPIDPASLESALLIEPELKADSGTLINKKYKASVSYDKLKLNAYIVSEPIGVPIDTVSFKIKIGKNLSSSIGGKSISNDLIAKIMVPGLTGFMEVTSIENTLVKTLEERYERALVISGNGTIGEKEIAKKIHAWLLPVDRPDLPGIQGEKNTRWNMIDLVTKEVLDISEPISLKQNPSTLAYNPSYSFTYSAPVGRSIFVRVDEGLEFYGGYRQKDNRTKLFTIQDFPREVKILSEGSIVPLNGSKQVSLYSRGLEDIAFWVSRVRPDDINHLISQSNGDLKNFNFNNWKFNEYNISEQYSSKTKVPIKNASEPTWFSFNFSEYLQSIPSRNLRHGIFIFTVEGNTDATRRYKDRRLIIVSDLGIYVKRNYDGSSSLFVQSIQTGKPVEGAEVSVIGLNGNPLYSGTTNGTGRLNFPNLSGYVRDLSPTAWLVKKGEDLSFLPYAAKGRSLDWSNFDTGGVYGATDPKKINAFLFSDRGIYRPGDTINIGIILKAGSWKIPLSKTPVLYTITNPNGIEVYSKKSTVSDSGFEELNWKTESWSPTGEYTATAYLILDETKNKYGYLGSETIKVEEFLPDTLTIKALLSSPQNTAWIKPETLEGSVSLKNLFGSPASGNDIQASIQLNPGFPSFSQFKEYRFRDPLNEGKSYTENLGTKKTDAEGKTSFAINLTKFEKASYRLRFMVDGYEKASGRVVRTEEAIQVSPLDFLVGYKADGDLSYISSGSKRTLSFIAVGPDGNKTAVEGLKATVYETSYVSMLVKQPNDTYKYQSVKKTEPIENFETAIPLAGASWEIPNQRQGDFELVLSDKDNLEYAKISWSVVGGKNVARKLDRNAELEVKLEKNDYKNGDTIQLFIKAPYTGSGLITIERDKVYTHQWFTSNETSSIQTIQVPEDLEGNAYVTVTWARSVNSEEIFMSPLCYASVPFSISREKRTNVISLTTNDKVRPGEELLINYATSSKGKIAIMAVDEGILQVARYKTPDPLSFFFKKRALEVQTQQIMDLILPEYNILRTIGAMGGDAMSEELGRNLNPFKRRQNEPVAFWSGVIDSGPETKSLSYRIPDWFNGTVRVMAIAVSDETIGASETKLTVQAPIIISPTMPLMASPGDEFIVPVTLTNLLSNSSKSNIKLNVSSDNNLSIEGAKSFDLSLANNADQTVFVKVKALNSLGNAELKFEASSGSEKVKAASTMSIRPALPYRTSIKTGFVKNSTVKLPVEREVFDAFAERDISLSYLPTGLAKGLWFYLKDYPYQCSEQITSMTWPYLYPNLVRELKINADLAKEKIDATISILQSRVRPDGSIGFWTNESRSELYLTNYCTLFLIDARDHGYYVSDTLYNSCIKGLTNVANRNETDTYTMMNRSFACYLLARSGTIATSYIEKLKQDIKRNPEATEGYTSLFLAGTQAILKQDLEAALLLSSVKKDFKKGSETWYADSLCYRSIYLDIVARHFPSKVNEIAPGLLEAIAEDLSFKQPSSLSANHALMGIESYIKRVSQNDTKQFSVHALDADKTKLALSLAGELLSSGKYPSNTVEIQIENQSKANLFYQLTTAGFDLKLPTKEVKESIEIAREFTDAKGSKLTSFKVGDEVRVKLSIRSTSGKDISDIALVDLFPAGFEPDIASIRSGAFGSTWKPEFIDIREDRIVLHGTAGATLQNFVYAANIVNAGNFAVPPLFAEALYDRSITAYKPQDSIIVREK